MIQATTRARAFATIAFLVGLSSCARDPDASFWAWFRAHAAEVASTKTGDEPIFAAVGAELHKVDPRLFFEVGTRSDPHELVISADGNREAFLAVRRLVERAPRIRGWKIVAFRQRSDPAELDFSGTTVRVADLTFSLLEPIEPGKKLDVAIYAPPPAANIDSKMKGAVFLILDAWLGEEDTEDVVGIVRIEPAHARPADARPFAALRDLVDRQKITTAATATTPPVGTSGTK